MAHRVPFVDYPLHYQNLRKEITKMLDDVLFSRADLILRGDLRDFENNIAAFLGVKYGIGLGSCTDALFLSLKAAGIGPGDEVITVAQTFVATVAAIYHCGATPILVDIAEDFNMNADLVEQAVTSKTKAIIPVHLNGRACDMEKIMRIAAKHKLIVIEDTAQSLGATFDGKKVGSFGLTSCFSFFPAKILGSAGDGGMVCTDDKEMTEKFILLRDHGRQTKNDLVLYGFNSRLDNIQAALLNLKLKYLPQWIERRRYLAQVYENGLSEIAQIKLPPKPESNGRYFDVYQNYVIRAENRDKLVEHLDKQGVEVLISWAKPMHFNKPLGLSHFHLPVTEQISNEVISLPMNTELSDEQAEYVIKSVRSFYSK